MDPAKYDIYIHRLVAETIYGLRGTQKRALLDFIDEVKADPFCVADFKKNLGSSEIEVKVAGAYSLYFFADHAAKEVKIIDCLRSDPA